MVNNNKGSEDCEGANKWAISKEYSYCSDSLIFANGSARKTIRESHCSYYVSQRCPLDEMFRKQQQGKLWVPFITKNSFLKRLSFPSKILILRMPLREEQEARDFGNMFRWSFWVLFVSFLPWLTSFKGRTIQRAVFYHSYEAPGRPTKS